MKPSWKDISYLKIGKKFTTVEIGFIEDEKSWSTPQHIRYLGRGSTRIRIELPSVVEAAWVVAATTTKQ